MYHVQSTLVVKQCSSLETCPHSELKHYATKQEAWADLKTAEAHFKNIRLIIDFSNVHMTPNERTTLKNLLAGKPVLLKAIEKLLIQRYLWDYSVAEGYNEDSPENEIYAFLKRKRECFPMAPWSYPTGGEFNPEKHTTFTKNIIESKNYLTMIESFQKDVKKARNSDETNGLMLKVYEHTGTLNSLYVHETGQKHSYSTLVTLYAKAKEILYHSRMDENFQYFVPPATLIELEKTVDRFESIKNNARITQIKFLT